jgi:branched-chain amino acid transport system substrate-binding protein
MTLTRTLAGAAVAATLALQLGAAHAQKGETVKIAWIDAITGMTAATGQNQLKSFQFLAEKFSASNPAGVKFEIVPFDNKLSVQETVSVLQAAIDQGIRYVAQGTGTGPATAIIDFLNKYNERNPGKEVVFINYAAVDPDLTNSKCSYWHFRMDADTSMKMEALSSFMKDQADIKKVYLINQNYAHGHQVARFAKENLARKRPDVQIVGEDLTPLAQTRDFAPYIAKIKASGADTVVTGNWSSDLTLLIKAANDAGLNAKFYTYYAGVSGTPTAMGAGAVGRVYQVSVFPYGVSPETRKIMDEYKAKFNDDFYTAQVYQGQEHRPGQGGGGDGGPVGQEPERRGDDAQGRPPDAADALHHGLAQGRQGAERLQRREHRPQLPADQDARALRVEHADVVPDEEARRLTPRAACERARRQRLRALCA